MNSVLSPPFCYSEKWGVSGRTLALGESEKVPESRSIIMTITVNNAQQNSVLD